MGGHGLSGVARAMESDGMVAILTRTVENSPSPKQLGTPDTSTTRQDHMLTMKRTALGSWSMPMQGIEHGRLWAVRGGWGDGIGWHGGHAHQISREQPPSKAVSDARHVYNTGVVLINTGVYGPCCA